MRTVIFCVLVCFSAARAGVLHVSPLGDDANEGTQAKPLTTLQAAGDRARLQNPVAPGTVIVHAGTYVQGATLELSAADPGMTWRAAGDGEVRISGGPIMRKYSNASRSFSGFRLSGSGRRRSNAARAVSTWRPVAGRLQFRDP
jgi:hypothetical protein